MCPEKKESLGLIYWASPVRSPLSHGKSAKHCLNCIKKEWHSISAQGLLFTSSGFTLKCFVETEDIETQCQSERWKIQFKILTQRFYELKPEFIGGILWVTLIQSLRNCSSMSTYMRNLTLMNLDGTIHMTRMIASVVMGCVSG